MPRIFIQAALIALLALPGRIGAAEPPPGDINGDGTLDLADIALLSGHLGAEEILPPQQLTRADANQDGCLDAADLLWIAQHLFVPTPSPSSTPTASPSPSPSPTATPGPNDLVLMLPGDLPLPLVKIPAGTFQMGSVDPGWSEASEAPPHTVTIPKDFYMGKYEITQSQWLALMPTWPGVPPSEPYGLGDDYAAYGIGWVDAQAFINALNIHLLASGQGPRTVRLPTEAEWEYACRSGTETRFYHGQSDCAPDDCIPCDLVEWAWYCGTHDPGVHIVGTTNPNNFGLYDMLGNVREWCQDRWHEDYAGAPTNGSAWVTGPDPNRVIRGGHWSNQAHHVRSASRVGDLPEGRWLFNGFRLAADD